MKTVLPTLASFLLAVPLWAQSTPSPSPDAPSAVAEVPAKAANLWQVVAAGGPTMIPLGLLSIITVMLVIIYLITMRRRAVVSRRFMETAEALIRKNDHLGLVAITNRHNGAVARILRRVMEFMTRNPGATLAEAREIAQTEGMRQASALNQQVSYLADIGTIAPMLGLLGTVMGIVQSFGVIAVDAAATRPTLLAQGIGEALIATATGLLIGIPAMGAYAFFRGRTQGMISEMEIATAQLMAQLSVSANANGESADKKTSSRTDPRP